jgi:hypothetical protein
LNLNFENLSIANDSVVLQRALEGEQSIIDIENCGTAMRFLTAYFAFTTLAVGVLGLTASVSAAYLATTGLTSTWLAAIPGWGWAILAVIAILYVAGVDIGSELANAEDSVKDALADVDDWVSSW